MKKVFLDLDGVLADWVGRAVETFGLYVGSPAVDRVLASDPYGIDQLIRKEDLWTRIDAEGDRWWSDIKPFPWAKYLFDKIDEVTEGNACILSMPGWYEDTWAGGSGVGKVQWLRREIGTEKFLFGKCKHFCASPNAMLIDDSADMCGRFRDAGGSAALFPNVYGWEVACPQWHVFIDPIIECVRAFYVGRGDDIDFIAEASS
jgi:hypothetical protein